MNLAEAFSFYSFLIGWAALNIEFPFKKYTVEASVQ